jgi:hypothetical protein
MNALLGLFVLAATTVATPPSTPDFLSAPAQCSSTSAPAEQPGRGPTANNKAFCQADCGFFNLPVSCSGTTCSAVNQDQACPAGPGSVTCDGQTYYCASCCTSGQIRFHFTGPNCSCDEGRKTPKDRYQCVDGVWEYQSSSCGAPFCQGV